MTIRFAVVSDPHIALPETIEDTSQRFHLVEVSISALELAFEHLEHLDLDFLLMPGDLTQDGEPENHRWLQQRLARLPFPAYIVPGNHDVPSLVATDRNIGLHDFPSYYQAFGYDNPNQLYYTKEIYPGVQLVGLNSNQFNPQGKQLGVLDEEQLLWLEQTLVQFQNKFVLIIVHHNVLEHLPGQAEHELGKRYMLDNAPTLRKILQNAGVKLILTGHLHVQDIVQSEGLCEITTGSLVSYPHPYRIVELDRDASQGDCLRIKTHRIESTPQYQDLLAYSQKMMSDRSYPFMMKLLTIPPVSLPIEQANLLAPKLHTFWSQIAAGDTLFDFPDFPSKVREHFQKFGAINSQGKPALIDNQATLYL